MVEKKILSSENVGKDIYYIIILSVGKSNHHKLSKT